LLRLVKQKETTVSKMLRYAYVYRLLALECDVRQFCHIYIYNSFLCLKFC
jgi:hypothetical protein